MMGYAAKLDSTRAAPPWIPAIPPAVLRIRFISVSPSSGLEKRMVPSSQALSGRMFQLCPAWRAHGATTQARDASKRLEGIEIRCW